MENSIKIKTIILKWHKKQLSSHYPTKIFQHKILNFPFPFSRLTAFISINYNLKLLFNLKLSKNWKLFNLQMQMEKLLIWQVRIIKDFL